MDRSLVPPLPPANNPTPRSSTLTRQQWVFLLLVGASSFIAFHAVYTSLRLYDNYDDRHHVSFHAPPIEQKKGNINQASTKTTMSTLHQDEPNQQRTQDLPQQERQQRHEEEETQSSNQSKRENDIVETPLERQSEVNSTNDPSSNEQTQPEQRVKEETKQQQQQQQQQPSSDRSTAKPPLNILVFYGDDWRHDQLGHLNPLIHSPNIDHELAGKGVRFTHNCVTTSVCGVSRATYYTGQYMSRHGTNRSIELFRPWPELFPYFLKQAGYHIGYVGKGGLFPFHWEHYDTCNMFEGYHIDEKEDNGRHITQRAEDEAIKYLSTRPMDKPFYLTIAFYATHAVDEDPRQYIPMNHSMALYQETVIPIPATATEESWKRMPPFFSEHNEARRRWHKRFDEPEKHQRMMKNYYRLITEVDTVVGNVLKVLEDQDAINNTLIIFTTDNGNFHSEHGLADKFYPHQESIRVPLIVRDPRMADGVRNTTNDVFTLNVDLAATILSAANVTVPDYYQGRDVSELYRPQPFMVRPWRTEFFYEFPGLNGDWVPASQALVRKEHKYMLWTDHGYEQFFDLVRDPFEDHDVFNDTEYQDIIQEMKARFVELREAAK